MAPPLIHHTINKNNEASSIFVIQLSGDLWLPPTKSNNNFSWPWRGMPLYESALVRRLGGMLVGKGAVFFAKLHGNQCSFRVDLMKDEEGNQLRQAIVNRSSTRLEILHSVIPFEDFAVGGIDDLVLKLSKLIVNSYENINLHQYFNIPLVKSALITGVSGVGKLTLVRSVCRDLQLNIHIISIMAILAERQHVEDSDFLETNPLRHIFETAIWMQPAVVLIKDLDLLGKESDVDGTTKTLILNLLVKYTAKIRDHDKVFVIGFLHERSTLFETFQKAEIFQHELVVPIPTRKQREDILRIHLRSLILCPFVDGNLDRSVMDQYSIKIAQKTSGYVARDLNKLCQTAVLHAIRRWSEYRRPSEEVEQLTEGFENLTIDESNERIDYKDFEYALSISKPSQQANFESLLPKRSWDEIGGYTTLKTRIKQIVLLPQLKVESYDRLGIKPPSGMLLYGPSGCGKTILVHALASESIMNVISVKGPEIFSKYLGESERFIRRLFSAARQIAPCIIFFDEMDSIAIKRGWEGESTTGVGERVLSTLLNEMDGIEEKRGVFVIGCTNQPHMIDDAVLRPGRLDHLFYVGHPSQDDRRDIARLLAKKMPCGNDVNFEEIAALTEGFTGAGLEALFREAAIRSLRENISMELIHWRHFYPIITMMAPRARESISEMALGKYRRFQEQLKN